LSFTALAYTTLDRLLEVFPSIIFAVLLKIDNTSNIGNLGAYTTSSQYQQTHSQFFGILNCGRPPSWILKSSEF